MTKHVEYARLLLQTHRPAEAEREARAGLEQAPNDALLLHTLGNALIEQEKFKEARDVAHRLREVAPDWADAHHLNTFIELESRRYKAAELSAQEALRIAPNSATAHHNLAACYMAQSRWEDALREAEAGLALDPEHDGCANLRSVALTNLGRKIESWHSTAGALRRNPESPAAHITAGYVKLQGGEREPALEHFTQALRLDPTNEQARHGLLMAMKARNPVYRQLLKYSFWMMRLTPAQRWKVAIGAVIGVNILDNLPNLGVWAVVIEVVYVGFAMLTWVGSAFFDFLLLLDRRLRHVLDARQSLAAVALVLCLAAALAWLVAGVGWDLVPAFWAMDILLFAIPLTRAFRKRRGWKKPAALAVTIGFGLLLIFGLGLTVWNGNDFFAMIELVLLVLYTWFARMLDN